MVRGEESALHMRNTDFYVSTLLAATDMFCRETKRLEFEKNADRAYPICALEIEPKLTIIVIATGRILKSKLLFASDVSHNVAQWCIRLSEMLETAALPLITKMRQIADPYRGKTREELSRECLQNEAHCRPFRTVLKEEYSAYVEACQDIQRLGEELKKKYPEVAKAFKPNLCWVPQLMLR